MHLKDAIKYNNSASESKRIRKRQLLANRKGAYKYTIFVFKLLPERRHHNRESHSSYHHPSNISKRIGYRFPATLKG